MMGECTGKVRSTPTPKLTLRTVKVSRLPLPLRRITTPWNTWTRSRLPSTTRTCTFRVSPGANSGTSSRSCVRSTRSVAFIEGGSREQSGRESNRLRVERVVGELAPGRVVLLVGGTALEQVGTSIPGAAQRRRPTPARDPRMVTAAQHLGHRVAPELG